MNEIDLIDHRPNSGFSLKLRELLSPLLRNLLLTKLPCFPPQHIRPFLNRQLHLLPHRHQALRQMQVVLSK